MPLKNKEERKIWNKAWRTRNADILRDKRRARRNTERGKLLRKFQYDRYCQKHPEEIKSRAKKYRENNAESCRLSVRKSYHKHRERTRIKQIEYEKANKEKICLRRKRRRQNDPQYRIRINIRRKILLALERARAKKSLHTNELIGCSFEFLKRFLEKQFKSGMKWENHGRSGWHIDHKKPCCSFNLLDPEEQKKCFHFSNLQPLWAFDNLCKGAKLEQCS